MIRKKFIAAILCVMFAVNFLPNSFSGQAALSAESKLSHSIILLVGKNSAYVNGQRIAIDENNPQVVPFIEQERTLVPVRMIAQGFGLSVDWQDDTQTVTLTEPDQITQEDITVPGKQIQMVLGEKNILVDGQTTTMDIAPNTYHDRTFLPLRALAEALGKEVLWDDRGLIIIAEGGFMLDQEKDQEIIDQLVSSFDGAPLDFAVVDEGKGDYLGTIGQDDYMLDYQNPDELEMRGGIGNTIRKLKAGEPVTIGYLGGSITLMEGWRPKTTAWLKAQYPQSEITEVNACVNGTGADLGACRVGSELLVHQPDLVFVEYAVNGGEGKHMEGIIRQIWQNNLDTDICLVYTISEGMIGEYQNKQLPAITRAFDQVAEYYNIPAIFFGYQIVDLLDQGKLTFKAAAPEADKILFSTDGVHPTEDGAILYAGAVARSFVAFDQASDTTVPHELKTPYHKDNWEKAKVVDFSKADFQGNWFECVRGTDPSSYGTNFPYTGTNLEIIRSLFPKMMGTKTAGDSVTIKFKGTTFGFFDVGGPFAGQLKVSVDGAPATTLNRFTIFSSHIRQQYVFLPEMEDTEHTIVLTLDQDSPDKSIVADSITNPEPYQSNEFYLGSFIIIGDIQ